MAHLILAGARRPEAALFCTVMVPLLEGAASEVRGQGLQVLQQFEVEFVHGKGEEIWIALTWRCCCAAVSME